MRYLRGDRRGRENAIRTIADVELDGDRSLVDGVEGWVGTGEREEKAWRRLQGGWSSPCRYLCRRRGDWRTKGRPAR